MTDYITEQEQIEQLKKWVKDYGLTILAGIVVALIIITGWHYYQRQQNKILMRASVVYDHMLSLRSQNNPDGTVTQATKLLQKYPNTPYATMAAFMLARDATLKKNYSEAINQLNWAVDHSKDHAIRDMARIRLARILISEKKPQAALDALSNVRNNSFKGLAEEVKGDAYLAMNNAAAAKKAYQTALKELPNAEIIRPTLQMKFDNLNHSPA